MFLILAFAAVVFSPQTLRAQECPDGLFSYVQVDEHGNGVRVCAKSTRQTTQAVAAIGALDPGRAVSTRVGARNASTWLSPSTSVSGDRSGTSGFYPAPNDPRAAAYMRDALLDGFQATAYEEEVQQALDRAVRDGQHQATMMRFDTLESNITGQMQALERKLRSAIASGDKKLEASTRAQIAALTSTPTASAPTSSASTATGGGASTTSATPVAAPVPPAKLKGCAYALTDPDKCRKSLPLVGKK